MPRACIFLVVSVVFAFGPKVVFGQAGALPVKELVAVMDLESVGATKAQISACSERLREELLQTNRFRLVDRSEMSKIMDEQALQQTGCTSQECMVKVGRILGVRKLITGRVTKVEDDFWMISGMLLDVESAETLRVASVQHDGNFRTLLGAGMATLAIKLQGPTPLNQPLPPVEAKVVKRATPAASRPPAAPPVSVAMFPILITDCRDTFSTCGGPISPESIATAVATALKASGRANVINTVYPKATPGTALALEKPSQDGFWSGVFSKAPDAVAIANRARDLNVSFAVTATAQYDATSTTISVFVVDVASRVALNDTFVVRRTASGRIQASDMNGDIGALIDTAKKRAAARAMVASGTRHSKVVMLPIAITTCRDTMGSCASGIEEDQFADMIAQGLKEIRYITIAGSYYPDIVLGPSLRENSALASGVWAGGLANPLNVPLLRASAPQVGAESYLAVSARYDLDSATFELQLVDVATGAVVNAKFRTGRDSGGRVDQVAINREIQGAFEKFLGQPQ